MRLRRSPPVGARPRSGREQIHFLFAQQAQAQLAVRRQARAGAGGAERQRDRRDEAQLALRARQAVDARFAIQLAVGFRAGPSSAPKAASIRSIISPVLTTCVCWNSVPRQTASFR